MTVTQYLTTQGYAQEEILTILEELEYQRQQERWDSFDDDQVERLWPEAEDFA